jgi:DNA uptake protein ComE-like DNA-binding protein
MYMRFCVGLLAAALFFSGSASADTLLNANSSTAAQLAAIPGLNATRVKAVTQGAPFATIGDLNAVLSTTMNKDELQSVYTHLFIPISLNTASRKDMLLIPGLSKRMAHEFEEYRPYTSMEQFRREIGKYVDDAEVARLEMYVTLD